MPSFAPYNFIHDVSQVETNGEIKMKSDQQYNALRDVDSQSDSSTEIGDWEPGADANPLGSRTRRIGKKLSRYRWLLDTTLLLVIVVLLVERRWFHIQGHQYEFAGDITDFAPTCECTKPRIGRQLLKMKVSQQIVTFQPNPILAPENASEFWNRDVQQAWLNIIPVMWIAPSYCLAVHAKSQQKGWDMSRLKILRGMTTFHSQSTTMLITLYSQPQ